GVIGGRPPPPGGCAHARDAVKHKLLITNAARLIASLLCAACESVSKSQLAESAANCIHPARAGFRASPCPTGCSGDAGLTSLGTCQSEIKRWNSCVVRSFSKIGSPA